MAKCDENRVHLIHIFCELLNSELPVESAELSIFWQLIKKAILVPSVTHLLCCIPDLKALPDVSFVIYKDVNTGPTSSWKICIHIFSTPISSCKGPQRKLRHRVNEQQFANRKETIPGLVEICWPVDYWQSVQPLCWTRKCVTTANAPVAARAHEQESSELNSSP